MPKITLPCQTVVYVRDRLLPGDGPDLTATAFRVGLLYHLAALGSDSADSLAIKLNVSAGKIRKGLREWAEARPGTTRWDLLADRYHLQPAGRALVEEAGIHYDHPVLYARDPNGTLRRVPDAVKVCQLRRLDTVFVLHQTYQQGRGKWSSAGHTLTDPLTGENLYNRGGSADEVLAKFDDVLSRNVERCREKLESIRAEKTITAEELEQVGRALTGTALREFLHARLADRNLWTFKNLVAGLDNTAAIEADQILERDAKNGAIRHTELDTYCLPDVRSATLDRWQAIKARYPGVLLLFRLGDFYEFFGPDAEVASRALELTLTSRQFGAERLPMCGLPYHALERYLPRLVQAGHQAAICEPLKDSLQSAQEVTRVMMLAGEPALTPWELAVSSHLSATPVGIDVLWGLSGLETEQVQSALVTLELKQVAQRLPGNQFVRRGA